MSRTGITQVAIKKEIPQVITPENAEILTLFYEKIARNFLDILILKKLKEKQMRLCELCRLLRKETFISTDLRQLQKRIKSMEKEKIIQICNIRGRKFYSLTSRGRKIIEVLQERQCQINKMVQSIIS